MLAIHLDIQGGSGGGGGGGGGFPQKPKKFLKKSNKMKAFPLRWDFFTFLQGSLTPQNYEPAPKIPENNYQCSPAPWK